MYHKWQSRDVWFLRYGAWQTEFFAILNRFLPFYPPDNPKNQNFEKMKKSPGDIIIIMCTINDDPIMYGSWDMEHNRQNFLSFWTIFLHFYPANNPKNQTFEKMKKPPRDIITLDVCIINNNHMMYGSWDIEHNGQKFLSFWTIFCPFSPLTTQKIKNLKKWKKKPGDIILHKCDGWFLRYEAWQTKFFVI